MNIGLVLPPGVIGAPGRVLSYRELRSFALQAEALGLDSVWVYDHLGFEFPAQSSAGVLEGWTVLTGLAEATERVELGTFVICTAFRNPALLAKMAVTLDELSDQRLILGLGAGWHEPEFTRFGLPFDHLADRFEEAVQIIAPLVRQGKADFQGAYYAANDCELLPPPIRPIPIMIAAKQPRMMRLTAQYADSWNLNMLRRAADLREPRDALLAITERTGRDPATLAITAGVNIGFPDLPEVADLPGSKLPEGITGRPEEIAAGLRAFANLGVGHLMAWHYPLTPEAVTRFAEAARLTRDEP
ncbi:MAG: LLM class flavin-dependent oxidoreductase [Thermomicrobiales bacterium]|nr:LLM class flavin-dependent oxidoreductase [Thermomicrobiales bacterium]